jgi:PAS domain S-box-containing protein
MLILPVFDETQRSRDDVEDKRRRKTPYCSFCRRIGRACGQPQEQGEREDWMKSGVEEPPRAVPFDDIERVLTDEQRYRGIFEHAIEGIFQTTPDGRYIGANPALARMYGYDSAEELAGELRDIARQLYVNPGRRGDFLKEMERHGRVANFESQVFRKGGGVIWISENAVAVRDSLGRLLYYEGFVVEITERRAVEEELRMARAELERSLAELRATQQTVVQTERLRAVGEMVTGIAHDFNNTLSLIVGYGEMLERKCRQPSQAQECAEYAQIIITAALDAAETVHRLREFHRPTEPDERRAGLSLNKTIEQAVTFTRPRWEAESHARGMPEEVVTDLGRVPSIAGNGVEIREMLTNLIFNAVDAMPQGGSIILRTRAVGARVELTVTDTGTGMTEEVRSRCLEPYFTTKAPRGVGLGLAMVYGVVERHEGALEIQSILGRGTTFVLGFPAGPAEAEIVEQPAPALAARPLRILVVDDQPVQSELLAHALERDWHTVSVAANGREALELFERREFDLVITDKAMPEMNGDQLAVAVKSREPDIRVIMLTGFTAAKEGEEHMDEFIDRVLVKPVAFAELRQAIVSVMN